MSSTPRNAAAASVSSTASSFRRTSKASSFGGGSSPSFVAWCRKTFFGTSSTATAFDEAEEDEEEEQLVKANQAVTTSQEEDADDEEEDLEENAECPICTTVSKQKLSYSVPCHHQACERCWTLWVKQHEGKPLHCMICNQEMTTVKFVKTHKPSSALTQADELFEDTLRIVMTVNDKLGEIHEKLAATENHLGFLHEAAQMGELDQDALVSIVQVELVVVKEQLSALVQIASLQIAQLPKSYALLNTAMQALYSQASDMLLNDDVHVQLEAFCDMLQCEQSRGKFTTLKHQWDSVFTLLATLLDSSVVNVIIFMVPSESKSLARLMEQTKAKLSLSLPAITASGAEFEQLAQRLLNRVADEKVL